MMQDKSLIHMLCGNWEGCCFVLTVASEIRDGTKPTSSLAVHTSLHSYRASDRHVHPFPGPASIHQHHIPAPQQKASHFLLSSYDCSQRPAWAYARSGTVYNS